MKTNKKHQVHNLIILDESGSMMTIKDSIIRGFNELVQTIKGIEKDFPEQEHFISLVTFNGFGQKVLHFADPVSRLSTLDCSRYNPDSMTPLYDTLGFSFSKLKKFLQNETDYDVLVTILTDGEENASKEIDAIAIKKQIEELKQNRWTFTYIGTNHDVGSVAVSISIDNTLQFDTSIEGMHKLFAKEKSARASYSRKIRDNVCTETDFYTDYQSDKDPE